MNIRCIEILNIFINSNGEQNVDYLANKFGISKRMIRYDIDEINSFLKQNSMKEIEKKPNSPLKFHLSKEEKDSLINIINNINVQSYIFSTEERVGILLYELLSTSSECTYSTLQNKLAISKTTLVNDIKRVKNWLSKFEITVSKISNKGIKIDGEESKIRKAMISLLIENNKYNIIEALEKVYNNGNKNIIDNIKNFDINKDNMNYIKELIRDVEKELGIFSEEDFMNLVIVIFVIVNRHIAKQINIQEVEVKDEILSDNNDTKMIESHFESVSNSNDNKYFNNNREIKRNEVSDIDNKKNYKSSKDKKEGINDLKDLYKKEYEAALEVSNKLREKFSISITHDEINIITSKILSGSKSENNIFDSRDYFDACYIADKIIYNIKDLIKKDFNLDSNLYEGFINHLKSLIFRLKYNVVSKNPILDTIISNYNKEFTLVKEASRFIEEKFQYPLSDDEVGYLLMYIEAGIEKSKREDNDIKNIIIVCSAGFATGRLLEAKIKNNFKVNILGVTSVHNIKRFINLKNYNEDKGKERDKGIYIDSDIEIESKETQINKIDYIISSIDVEDKYGISIVKVSPILSEDDMDNLKNIFRFRKTFEVDYPKEDESDLKEKLDFSFNKIALNESNLNNFKSIKIKDINKNQVNKHRDNNIERSFIDRDKDKGINKQIDNTLNLQNILQLNDISEMIENEEFYKNLIDIIEKSCKVLNKNNLINDLKRYFHIDNNIATSIEAYISEENIQLNLEAKDWKEAIELSAAPLLKNKYITEDYVKEMINNVEKLGPYIVVDDEIAIPHAKPGKYVNSFGITINTFKTPIIFGSHKNVRILITIASISSENHIDLITQIMKLIEDESFIELLINSTNAQKDYILKKICSLKS